jgi:hypothetical protein
MAARTGRIDERNFPFSPNRFFGGWASSNRSRCSIAAAQNAQRAQGFVRLIEWAKADTAARRIAD